MSDLEQKNITLYLYFQYFLEYLVENKYITLGKNSFEESFDPSILGIIDKFVYLIDYVKFDNYDIPAISVYVYILDYEYVNDLHEEIINKIVSELSNEQINMMLNNFSNKFRVNLPEYVLKATGNFEYKKLKEDRLNKRKSISPEIKIGSSDMHLQYSQNIDIISDIYKNWTKFMIEKYENICVIVPVEYYKETEEFILNKTNINNCPYPIVIFELIIHNSKYLSHANAIIMDKNHKTIYRFDPSIDDVQNNQKIRDLFVGLFPEYTYTDSTSCPMYIQDIEKHVSSCDKLIREESKQIFGYCFVWTLMFLHYCIINEELSKEEIITSIVQRGNLCKKVRDYAGWLSTLSDKKIFPAKRLRKLLFDGDFFIYNPNHLYYLLECIQLNEISINDFIYAFLFETPMISNTASVITLMYYLKKDETNTSELDEKFAKHGIIDKQYYAGDLYEYKNWFEEAIQNYNYNHDEIKYNNHDKTNQYILENNLNQYLIVPKTYEGRKKKLNEFFNHLFVSGSESDSSEE